MWNERMILLLDHSTYRRHSGNMKADTHLLVAKNRVGPSEALPIQWDYETLRMTER